MHRHIFIACAGFLSQSNDYHQYWIHLKNYCRVRGMPFYAVRWESSDRLCMESKLIENADKNNIG